MKPDVLLIPCGGLTTSGEPNPWVCNRLDRAAELHKKLESILMPLGAGTPIKPPPLDKDGFPIFEANASALYLIKRHGIAPENILPEITSYSTLGNAAFCRMILTDPNPDYNNLHLITSEFHIPRCQLFFDWVFSLKPLHKKYKLTYETVPDVGLSKEMLKARHEKETSRMEYFKPIIQKITTLQQLQNFLLRDFEVYAAKRLLKPHPKLSEETTKSY